MQPNGMVRPVIMPVLNNIMQTEEAIRDVLAFAGVDHLRLLVIDQGSDDLTRQILGALTEVNDRHLRLWRHDPPLPSLSATWNLALKWAWHSGAESALVVNNDVRLPRHLYADLLEVQRQTGAWFVTAVNVSGDQWYEGRMGQAAAITPELLASRGGPDFSCFLITRECHERFQFDEGFQPAYHEDNDYHRRLELAGLGDRIFSVPIPYRHYGSGTLHDPTNQALRAGWDLKFAQSRDYYIRKWGGLPGSETYITPFGQMEAAEVDG